MIRQMLKYGAGLIAVYLVVANAEGAKGLITAGASGVGGVIRDLQGRRS